MNVNMEIFTDISISVSQLSIAWVPNKRTLGEAFPFTREYKLDNLLDFFPLENSSCVSK